MHITPATLARSAVALPLLVLTSCAAHDSSPGPTAAPTTQAPSLPPCTAPGSESRTSDTGIAEVGDATFSEVAALVQQAVHTMDEGDVPGALDMLQRANALAPNHPLVRYETAYAHYLAQNFASALAIAQVNTYQLGPTGYRLAGNIYDMAGDLACAMQYYDEGLVRFPDDGGLYLDLGVALGNSGKVLDALRTWERGIYQAPQHASNYFQASRVFAQTSAPQWSVMYGETFLALEPAGKRHEAVSQWVFALYEKHIEVKVSGSSATTQQSFVRPLIANPDGTLSFSSWWATGMEVSFGIASISRGPQATLDISTLHQARRLFVSRWTDPARPMPAHPLYDWYGELLRAELLEAYDHRVFASARPQEAAAWWSAHPDVAAKLNAWLAEHPLTLSAESGVSRSLFEPSTSLADASEPTPKPRLADAVARVRVAIAAVRASPVGAFEQGHCRVVVDFAEESDQVLIHVGEHTNPWVDGGTEPRSALLLCAFLAGNVEAQLERGTPADQPLAGVELALTVYGLLKRLDAAFMIEGAEEMLRQQAAGSLEAHVAKLVAQQEQ